jgi:hypothetical protein
MDLAGKQVDAGQQADRAVALIFMIAREGRVQAGLGWEPGSPVQELLQLARTAVAATVNWEAIGGTPDTSLTSSNRCS